MSNWILVGPIVGIVLLASGLILGYLVFPPIVTKTIVEVNLCPKRNTYYI